MKRADIASRGAVHRLDITYDGTRSRVESECDHGDAERVLAVLSGFDLHCEWPAAVLQHLLRKGIPFEEACGWARLPVTPNHPDPYTLWKGAHIKRPWSLVDLERWRIEGRSPQECAEFCASFPHRVNWPKGPS